MKNEFDETLEKISEVIEEDERFPKAAPTMHRYDVGEASHQGDFGRTTSSRDALGGVPQPQEITDLYFSADCQECHFCLPETLVTPENLEDMRLIDPVLQHAFKHFHKITYRIFSGAEPEAVVISETITPPYRGRIHILTRWLIRHEERIILTLSPLLILWGLYFLIFMNKEGISYWLNWLVLGLWTSTLGRLFWRKRRKKEEGR